MATTVQIAGTPTDGALYTYRRDVGGLVAIQPVVVAEDATKTETANAVFDAVVAAGLVVVADEVGDEA